jgi:hypothetical protein
LHYGKLDFGRKVMVTFELEDREPYYTTEAGTKVLALNAKGTEGSIAEHPFWGTSKWRDNIEPVLTEGVYEVREGSLMRDAQGVPVGWAA